MYSLCRSKNVKRVCQFVGDHVGGIDADANKSKRVCFLWMRERIINLIINVSV